MPVLVGLLLSACSISLPTDAQIQAASPAGLQTIENNLRALQKDYPDNPRVLLQLALALLRRGALAEAELAALQADQQAPAQGIILSVLAEVYLAEDRRFRALTTASQAIQLDPDLLSAYVTAARANALLGEPDKGIRALNEALRREPRYFPAWYYRARILFDTGAVREAETSLIEALRINPTAKEAGLLQIKLVKRTGRLASAAYLIESGSKTWPDDSDLLMESLDLYRQRRDWAGAARVLPRLQALGPLPPEAQLTQLEILQVQGQTQAFRAGLQELTTANPRFTPGWIALARAALAADRPEEAIPSLTRAVDLDPGSVEARYWLAVAYYQTGEVLQGNATAAEAMRQAPDYPPLRLLRVRRALLENRLDSAGALIEEFLKDYPFDIEATLLKSEWLVLSGDYTTAGTLLAGIPPVWDNQVLRFARARLAYVQGQYRAVVDATATPNGDGNMPWRQAYLRGAALARLSQHREALNLLTPYLRLSEPEGRMHRLVGDIHQMAGDRRAAERVYLDGLVQFPRKLILLDALSRLAVENENWAQARETLERGLEGDNEFKAVFLDRLTLVFRRLNNAGALKTTRDKYLEAADPVRKESLRPSDQGVLFSMTTPPLEPVFRAAPIPRVPSPPIPGTTPQAPATSRQPGQPESARGRGGR